MIRIGTFEITRIEESQLPEPSSLFAEWNPDIAAQHRDWMGRSFYDPDGDTFVSSIHAYLVKSPGHTFIIDTAGGNDKERPASPRFDHLNLPFLERLAAAGVQPGDVDIVINTHLHVDHVGWNTRLVDGQWVPTFANATYYFPRVEVEARDPDGAAASRPPATQLPFRDSVRPILDSGNVKLVEGTETIAEGIDLMPVPGHAPGQMAVRLRSEGKEALFIADVMHQPLQVYHPGWNSKYCENQDLARETRRKVLDHCAEHGSLIFPGHFGAPHCGTISREGDGYRLTLSDTTP